MPEFLGKITDILKSSLSFAVAIFLASVIIVLLPKSVFEYLELNNFPINIKPWASLVLFISGALIIVQLLIKGYAFSSKRSKDNQERERKLKRLENLTPEEKRHLAFYLSQNNRSESFNIYDGVILQLEKDGVVCRMITEVSHNYGVMAGIPFNISDWAWDILLAHPEYVLSGQYLENYKKASNPQ